jgi:hypothetical protein
MAVASGSGGVVVIFLDRWMRVEKGYRMVPVWVWQWRYWLSCGGLCEARGERGPLPEEAGRGWVVVNWVAVDGWQWWWGDWGVVGCGLRRAIEWCDIECGSVGSG